jgi:hypothetical protein
MALQSVLTLAVTRPHYTAEWPHAEICPHCTDITFTFANIFLSHRVDIRCRRSLQNVIELGASFINPNSVHFLVNIKIYIGWKRKAIKTLICTGADKSLAWLTSPCRWTESIVSLEIHAILTEILEGNMHRPMPPSKTGVGQFNPYPTNVENMASS